MTSVAASVRDRLLNHARHHHQDFNAVLVRYGVERLLYRISASAHADRFVLKGAQLLLVHTAEPHRPTKDIDLLALHDADANAIARVFREICATPVPFDGLMLHEETVAAAPIREHTSVGGVRVRLLATLDRARIHLQIDIGFGDVITPAAERVTYPVLLTGPAPVLSGYPLATVVAEKVESLVALGMATSRMKDVFDLWYVLRTFEVPQDELGRAIDSTFDRRGTPLHPTPTAFTPAFWGDASKRVQWSAYCRRNNLIAPDLEDVVREIATRIEPLMRR